MITCPKCRAENRDDAEFCTSCGAKLHEAARREKTFEESHFNPQVFAALLAALLIIAALILLVSSPSIALPKGTTTTVTPSTLNPTSGLGFAGDIEYNKNTTLTGDISTGGNIVVDLGIILTTSGHNLVAGETLNNIGVIDTGTTQDNAALGTNGVSYASSYGGSGGSGGGGGGSSSSGATPKRPKLNNTLVGRWYTTRIANYLTGAGGGGGCQHNGTAGNGGDTLAAGGIYSNPGTHCTGIGGVGGSGAYGIYIQAQRIVAGTINANGQQGSAGTTDGGGGGGGGVIVLAYGSGGYLPDIYNVKGGAAQINSGAGGDGQVLNYSYGSIPPIPP